MVLMMSTLREKARLLIAFIAALPLAASAGGCSPAATDPGPRPDGGSIADGAPMMDAVSQAAVNMVGCQHLKNGPFSPVTVVSMSTYVNPGPPIDNSGKAYRLTLLAPPRTGWVSFKVPASGDWAFFTSRPVPIQMFTWDGLMIAPKDVASSVPECTEVKSRETFPLVTDTKPHVIKLGGDSATGVDVVVTSAGP
jgi:hypothetical protein